MSDIVERLGKLTASTGRDHRSGKEFVLCDDTQIIVDALRKSSDEITRLRRELAEARNAALEEASAYFDDVAEQHDASAEMDDTDDGKHHHTKQAAIQRNYASAIRRLKEKAE